MRVALTYDTLRFGESAGDADTGSAWLWPLVTPALEAAGCRVTLHRRSESLAAEAIAAAGSLPSPEDAWPFLYSDRDAIEVVRPTCRTLLEADLVIGHELSPNQLRILHAAGRPVLDLSLGPARFGRDLFLRARTTDPVLAGLITASHVADAVLAREAEAVRARIAATDGPTDPVLLFVGQVDADASLIEGARLQRVSPFVERIRGMLEPGWRLLLKPHPYARFNADILALREAVAGSRIVNDGIYTLLGTPAVRRVVTLSSSVAAEAGFFGTEATALVSPDRDTCPPPMHEGRITVDALRGILRRRQGAPPDLPPIDLRRSVGHAWGYRREPRRAARTIKAGQAVAFSEAGTGGDLCTLGWSAPEADGCWSDGPLALLLLQPAVPGLFLTLRLAAFVPRGTAGLHLEIRGAQTRISAFFGSTRSRDIVLQLPADSGEVELRFGITGMASPAEHGISRDQRKLGVKLLRAQVTAAAPISGRARDLVARSTQLAASLASILPFLG